MVHLRNLKISVLLTFLSSCSFPEKDCKKFKTGNFEFKTEIDGKEYVSYFQRSDSTEIEVFNGVTDTSSVRWVSDCEFILKNINPKKSKKSITMKILSTENDSYTFEYSIVGDDSNKKRGKVFLSD